MAAAPPTPPLLPPVAPDVRRPTWSIVIPLYERRSFLQQCLASVLDQIPAGDEAQILVHDDASPSDLGPFVAALGRGRVTYVRSAVRRSLYGNVNAALALTTGRLIHVLHDDDFVAPGFYAAMAALLLDQQGPAVATCRYDTLQEPQGSYAPSAELQRGAGPLADFAERIAVRNLLQVPAVAYRRDVFERLGVFRDDLGYTADWEMYIRSAAYAPWFYTPQPLAIYRLHGGNLSWGMLDDGRAAADFRRTIEIAESYLPPAIAANALPQSRQFHAQYLLQAVPPALNAGKLELGVLLLREIIRLHPPTATSDAFFNLLSYPQTQPLREELITAWRTAKPPT